MRGNRFTFYATRKDWEKVLEIVENEFKIKYILNERAKIKRELKIYNSLLGYKDIGFSLKRMTNSPSFLVVGYNEENYYEYLPDSVSELKYMMAGQIDCPDSVYLLSGGIFENKYFVNGEISTISKTEFSQMLFKKFKSAFRKTCRNWHGTFIGTDAETYYPELNFAPYDGIDWNIFE